MVPAPAYPKSVEYRIQLQKVKFAYLVAGVDQGIGNHDILPSPGSENDYLGNVLASERLDAPGSKDERFRTLGLSISNLLVDSISLGLVSVEAHNRELLQSVSARCSSALTISSHTVST